MKGIKFCADINKTQVPFVPIGIDDAHFIAMLVDTGSTGNHIFSNAYNELKHMFSKTGKQASMFGVEGEERLIDIQSAEFYICGEKQQLEFQITDSQAGELLSENVGIPVGGIIGSNYMFEHGWIIDYSKQLVLITK